MVLLVLKLHVVYLSCYLVLSYLGVASYIELLDIFHAYIDVVVLQLYVLSSVNYVHYVKETHEITFLCCQLI